MTLIHPTIGNLTLSLCSKSICHFTISHLHVSYHLPTYCPIFPGVSLVQFSSVTQSFQTLCDPWTAARQASQSITNSWNLLKLDLHQVSDAIQPSHSLSSPSPPAFNFSQHQGLFQWVSSSHQVTKYWSLSFSISPSNEYLGPISLRIDWFDLPAV